MDLKERLNQVINKFQINIETMETEDEVKEQIEQLQSKLDVLLEENRRENRYFLHLFSIGFHKNKGSPLSQKIHETIICCTNQD